LLTKAYEPIVWPNQGLFNVRVSLLLSLVYAPHGRELIGESPYGGVTLYLMNYIMEGNR